MEICGVRRFKYLQKVIQKIKFNNVVNYNSSERIIIKTYFKNDDDYSK